MSAAADVLSAARARGWRIGTAESCTGGLVAAALTEVPGSSDVVERGVVTYSNQAKVELLGVRGETLEAHGAVSEETAAEMASGLLARAPVELTVSITGIAGPGGSDHKPEGRVCFGVATSAGTIVMTHEFGALGRDKVRAAAVETALSLLLKAATA